jgi:hypothetical protein
MLERHVGWLLWNHQSSEFHRALKLIQCDGDLDVSALEFNSGGLSEN